MVNIPTDVQVLNDVLLGKSGYLYLWMGHQEQFSYLTSENSIPEESILNFRNNILRRSKFLADKGIKYNHVVFPSKPLIKRAYLPGSLQVKSLYSQFGTIEPVIYPLNDLIELEKRVSTFRRLDTHMTDNGSLSVIKTLIGQLDKEELFDQVNFSSYSKVVSGDLAKMIDSGETSSEVYLEPLKYDGTKFIYKQFNNNMALKGNSGRVTVQHCINSLTDKRLIIFGDSFFHAALRLLAPFFRDIFFVRTPFLFKELVTLYKPDVVYSGNAERYLQSVPSDNNCGNFFFQSFYHSNYNPDNKFVDAISAELSYASDAGSYIRWAKNLKASLLNESANVFLMQHEYAEAAKILKQVVLLKPKNIQLTEKLNNCLKNI